MVKNRKKIFVTGGAGFLGSHVVKKLVELEHSVTVYDSFVIYSKPNPGAISFDFSSRLKEVYENINLIRGDTLNKDFLRRNLNEIKPDIIIHMAAMPLAALALEHTEEAYNSILTSTLNILEIIRDFKHSCRIVFLSSSMVYGDFLSTQVSETHKKAPKDIYGAFKLAGEYIVNGYAKNYSLNTVIVRPSAVYGPYDSNDRVVRKFIINALNKKPITIDGDGSLKMDFSYVEDTATGIALCSLKSGIENKIYNLSRGEAKSLKDLVKIIQENISDVKISYRRKPSYIPKRGSLDISNAKQDFNFCPKVNLEIGVKKYIEHLKQNHF